eukprot:gene9082-10353_t
MIDAFPSSLCKTKILPQLLQAFQFAGAGYQVLAPMLKIGKMLDSNEYQARIVPSLVKLFSSPDRATRISLLKKLPDFIEYLSINDKHLSASRFLLLKIMVLCLVVSNDIFPHVANGFSDTVPALREETVKSMLLLAPKLTQTILERDVIKHFARLQTDERPSIRTNTTICLGKIAKLLGPSTQAKVLVPAFLRALKDPFMHTRAAAAMALLATLEFYSPQVCASLLRLMNALLRRLEENSQHMDMEESKQKQDGQEQSGQKTDHSEVVEASSISEKGSSLLFEWASSTVGGFSKQALRKGAITQQTSEGPLSLHTQQQQQTTPSDADGSSVHHIDEPEEEWHDCVEPPSRLELQLSEGENDWEDTEWEDIDDSSPSHLSTAQTDSKFGVSSSREWDEDGGWEDFDVADELTSAGINEPKELLKKEKAGELFSETSKSKQQDQQLQKLVGKVTTGSRSGGALKLTRKKGLGAVKKV